MKVLTQQNLLEITTTVKGKNPQKAKIIHANVLREILQDYEKILNRMIELNLKKEGEPFSDGCVYGFEKSKRIMKERFAVLFKEGDEK